jgi:hypothetical protein
MNELKVRNGTPDGLISELDLGEFKASWVGECPGQEIALGGDDGRILRVNGDGTIVGPLEVGTDEAINGLAFLPNWIGISTRNEVCFVDTTPGEGPTIVPVPFGAHGIIVGPDGHFVAPLDTTGLLFFKPMKGQNLPITILHPRQRELCFYRVISISGPNGQRVVVAAARQDGIAAMPFDLPERGIHTLTYEAFDAIDVCPLAPSTLAAAALGKDGTIILCRDVIAETIKKQASVTTRFADIQGTAYRVLHAAGKLVVITSRAIYFLGEIVTNFLQGKTGPVTILEFPIKAIDANVVGDQWLLIVTARGVLKLDLRKLKWSEPGENGHERRVIEPTPLSPLWRGELKLVTSQAVA